jgi:general stress protein YciG
MIGKRNRTSRRGFASMSPERRREIASLGGKAVPPELRTFSRDNDLACSAGLKGGKSVAPENRSFSRSPELAREAGRRGGRAPRDKAEGEDA